MSRAPLEKVTSMLPRIMREIVNVAAPWRAALYKKLRGALARRPAELGPPYPWEAAYPPGVDWHAEIETKPLFAILDEAVTR